MPYDLRVAGDRDLKRVEDHESGTKLKNLWMDYKSGKATNRVIEVGLWTGELSDIKSFSVVTTISQASKQQIEYLDLSPEMITRNAIFTKKLKEAYKKIRLDQKGKTAYKGYTLTRSAINEYKQKYGTDCEIPEGTQIIED